MKKLLVTAGSSLLAIAPIASVVSMQAYDAEAVRQELFDNLYENKYIFNNNWADANDVVELFYEKEDAIPDFDTIYDFVKVERELPSPEETEFKFKVLAIENQRYVPGDPNSNFNRIAIDIEEIAIGKHWGITLDTNDPYSYKADNSAYSGLYRYLSVLNSMDSEWYKSLPKDSSSREYYEKELKKQGDKFKSHFFTNDNSIWKEVKSVIQNGAPEKDKSLSTVMQELGIKSNLDFNQVFNSVNALDFSKVTDADKVVISNTEFEYQTRQKGFIYPEDILNAKDLYKDYLVKELDKNGVKIDANKINAKDDIKLKVKKVAFFPEFELTGDWDIHYKAELSGALLGKPFVVAEKEVGMLENATGTYTQDIYKYLEVAAKKININADKTNLFPLQNSYKDFDAYNSSITQKAMTELFNNAALSVDKDYDISSLTKDLATDIVIKNIFLHNPRRNFKVQLKDLSVGFVYEAELGKDLTIKVPGSILGN